MLSNKNDSSNCHESILLRSLIRTLKKKQQASSPGLKRLHRAIAIAKINKIRRHRASDKYWDSQNS